MEMKLELIPIPVSDVERVRGLHLVVEDIVQSRTELVDRGVEVGDIQDFGGGVKGADFSDPDGNTPRAPGDDLAEGSDVLVIAEH